MKITIHKNTTSTKGDHLTYSIIKSLYQSQDAPLFIEENMVANNEYSKPCQ